MVATPAAFRRMQDRKILKIRQYNTECGVYTYLGKEGDIEGDNMYNSDLEYGVHTKNCWEYSLVGGNWIHSADRALLIVHYL